MTHLGERERAQERGAEGWRSEDGRGGARQTGQIVGESGGRDITTTTHHHLI
jgi:hypothetical protein